MLPAAAVEEEIVETPLDALYDQLDSRQQGTGKSKENRGRLEFEITSDDGFSCKSDTIDGKIDSSSYFARNIDFNCPNP